MSGKTLAILLLVVVFQQGYCKLVAEEELLYDTFPEGFIWGVASSAYQVEGGWEEGGKGLSNWDVWTLDANHTSDHSSGQVAADSYHHYKEDVKLAADIGVQVCFIIIIS